MNKALRDIMEKNTPKINPKVVDGTAKEVLAEIPAYLNQFFIDGLRTLSPKIDFSYLGYRQITPIEEYRDLVAKRDGVVRYDLSHNDVYVIEFQFEYDGHIIKRPVYLPYAEPGNLMVIGSAKYHITPVLSDRVISPSAGGVFVRLLKAKLNFTSRTRYFVVNGAKVAGLVIYGEILKPKQLTDNIGRPLTATALYLLGKYGLLNTLKNYAGVDDVIITTLDDPNPYEGYDLYTTTQLKPRGLKAVPYMPHNIVIGVRGDKMVKQLVDNVLFGLIYTLDILPEIAPDMVQLVKSGDLVTELSFWRITLGRVIYKNSFSVDRISQDLDDHFRALEGYIDPIIKTKLREGGTDIEDFFELVVMLLTNYNVLVRSSKEYNSNVENRYIDILYYLTCDTIIGFNRVILNLNKRITKTNKISLKEVEKVLKDELGTKRIYSLTKSTEPNLAVSSCD